MRICRTHNHDQSETGTLYLLTDEQLTISHVEHNDNEENLYTGINLHAAIFTLGRDDRRFCRQS